MGKKRKARSKSSTFKTRISHQNTIYSRGGRPRTASQQSWTRYAEDKTGTLVLIDPEPGRTYTRYNWPPSHRGRGESLTSPRRLAAKARAAEVIQLRKEGLTWAVIARRLGFRDASGPYRAMKRTTDRVDWDEARRQKQKRERRMYA